MTEHATDAMQQFGGPGPAGHGTQAGLILLYAESYTALPSVWPLAATGTNRIGASPSADLVLAGCAILEAIRRAFPCARLRVADRGLREGMLVQMMREDGAWGEGSADGGGQAVLS